MIQYSYKVKDKPYLLRKENIMTRIIGMAEEIVREASYRANVEEATRELYERFIECDVLVRNYEASVTIESAEATKMYGLLLAARDEAVSGING